MTSSERAQLTSVTVCAFVLTILLGTLFGWPGWLWILPGAALLGALVMLHSMLAVRTTREQELYRDLAAARRPEPPPPAPPPIEQPVHFEQCALPETQLPSATPDYDFLFSATVWWRPGPRAGAAPRANLPAKAVAALVERALPIVARERPEDWPVVRHRLADQLGEFHHDPAGMVEVSAADVCLKLDAKDAARLASFADTRKDAEVWQYERSHTEDKRRYYHDNVFRDPGSAVVWWLIKQGDNVRQTVDDMQALADLVAATKNEGFLLPKPDDANGHHLPAASQDVVEATERLMDIIGLAPDSDARTPFLDRLVRYMRAAGKVDEADRLQERFDLLAPEPPQWTPPEADGVTENGGGHGDGSGATVIAAVPVAAASPSSSPDDHPPVTWPVENEG